MNCPACPGKRLEERRIPVKDRSKPGSDATIELSVEACPDCAGLWFDKDELNRYLDAKIACVTAPQAGAKAAAAGTPLCPRCSAPLQKTHAPGNPKVTVDQCPKCGGMWLEAGEAEAAADLSGVTFQDRLKALFGGPGGT